MIDTDIKKFVLRRLLQKSEAASSTEIKLAIRSAFTAVFTEGDLDSYISQLQDDNFIDGTSDGFGGTLWLLTPKGRIHAQRMVKL